MKITTDEIKLRRKLYLILAISGILLYTVYCILFVPVSRMIDADYRYAETILPDLVPFVAHFFEIIAISVTCAVVTLGVVRFKSRGFAFGGVLYCLLVVYKYTLVILSSWIEAERIPSEWLWDIGYVLIMSIVEVLPFVVAWLFVAHSAKNYAERRAIYQKIGKKESLLPLNKIFGFENPLLFSTAVCSAVVLVTKLAGKAAYDIQTIQEVTNLPLMIVDYLVYIVFAVACYFVMLLTFVIVGEKLVRDLDI